MKKIYLIYVTIPEKVYNNRIKFLVSGEYNFRYKNGKVYGLYAFTNKKKIVNEFFETRNGDIYNLVEKELDEHDYELLRTSYITLELKLRDYVFEDENGNEKSIEVVSTKDEFVNSTIDARENLYEFGPKAHDIPVDVFKDKLLESLSAIGYVSDYYTRYGTDDERDFESYQMSFGMSTYGKMIHFTETNTFNVLLYLFSYMFYGKTIAGGDDD